MINPWSKKNSGADLEFDFGFEDKNSKSKNYNLHKAKKAKNDEFYTQLKDIEAELSHYPVECFKDKVVYCPCDMPGSNFVKYFTEHKEFGIKKLIHTSIQDGYDFRSDYCTQLLKESDIVVTNPPFSLFNEVIDWVLDANKQFILFGNRAAMSNKIIFDGIKNNRLWTGYATSHHMFFEVNNEYAAELKNDPTRKEGRGNSYIIEGDKVLAEVNACWYTNVEIRKRKEHIILYKKYNKEDYPTYDDYDNIIDVSKTKDIPMDYDGLMGVPVTFLESYCPEQFEIVDKVLPTLKGRKLYLRVVIKRR